MLRRFLTLGLFGVMVLAAGAGAADEPAGAKKKKGGKGPNLEAVFKKMDANGDGKISKDEFADFVSKLGNGKLKDKPKLIDKLFARADADGDGFLSKDELKKVAARLRDRAGKKVKP